MKKQLDPAMHTVEHILNRTMDRLFGCGRCFSAHIERKKSKCDYRFGRPLTDAELKDIEKQVNAVITWDLPVTAETISIQQAKRIYNLDRLPGDVGETIRVVKVSDYDACPCIGPHVNRTGDIPGFRLVSASHDTGVLRIRFKLQRQ